MSMIIDLDEAVKTPTIVKVKILIIGISDSVNGDSAKEFLRYARDEQILGKLSLEEANSYKAIVELYEIAEYTNGEVEIRESVFENGNQYRVFWVKFKKAIEAENFKNTYFASKEQNKYRKEIEKL